MATRPARVRASRKSAKPSPAGPSRAKQSRAKSRTAERVAKAVASPQLEVGMLGGLVLAMVLGAVGFIVSVFWVGAIVVMAILVGLTGAARRGGSRETGVVTEP